MVALSKQWDLYGIIGNSHAHFKQHKFSSALYSSYRTNTYYQNRITDPHKPKLLLLSSMQTNALDSNNKNESDMTMR